MYYLVYYLLCGVALIGLIVTGYWYDAPSVLLWSAWLGLVAWLLLYHVVVLRLHYRSLRRIMAQLSAYTREGERPSAEETTELAMRLGGDSLGMPEFLVRYLVKKFYRP